MLVVVEVLASLELGVCFQDRLGQLLQQVTVFDRIHRRGETPSTPPQLLSGRTFQAAWLHR
ncbi:hypothetical protein [Actinopolyspora mortivallis]|uniref:Uncharacterized protein n=1 Tax=Actinopolyspora mortivallis TaxID=33906 RepID=A0A2T0H1U7_ACTMO|nr:hypothetical protein [Actinopolyspora mortivallis]PRW65341.1 hypothetical protein CEP50_02205 [Actinopolyspora mortivallis]